MAITVMLEVQAQPEKAAELKQVFKEILVDTRAYDGCISVEVTENQDDTANLVLLEKWQSRAHYEKYFAWRVESGAIDTLGTFLAQPPSIRYYDTIDA